MKRLAEAYEKLVDAQIKYLTACNRFLDLILKHPILLVTHRSQVTSILDKMEVLRNEDEA